MDLGLKTTASTGGVLPSELLLIVFVHGFKGTDATFLNFPERLRHNLSETIPNVTVESIVFPSYETKGDLTAAVDKFADWLATLTVEREVAHGTGGGAGKANIVLCGHSMGGLLIADTFIAMANSRPDKQAPLWPKIIAVLAFDTPYYGLHPAVFKNKVTEGLGYAQKASELGQSLWAIGSKFSSSASAAGSASGSAAKLAITAPPATQTGWSKWAPVAYGVGTALAAGAAAGTVYWKKDDLGLGYQWITDHMKYVGNLWSKENLKGRVDKVVELSNELHVTFKTVFTFLPKKAPEFPDARTFILLPPTPDKASIHFAPNVNKRALDEISAHIGMFEASTNDGYYELGLTTANLIREAMSVRRDLSTLSAGSIDEDGKEDMNVHSQSDSIREHDSNLIHL